MVFGDPSFFEAGDFSGHLWSPPLGGSGALDLGNAHRPTRRVTDQLDGPLPHRWPGVGAHGEEPALVDPFRGCLLVVTLCIGRLRPTHHLVDDNETMR